MKLNVLIVEDEPLISMELQDIVRDAGHVVAGVAVDMREAMTVAAAGAVDLALLDVTLARRPDGVDVCRRLRDEHDVPSLFVSASITDEVRRRAAPSAPLGFVGKPFADRDVARPLQRLAAELAN